MQSRRPVLYVSQMLVAIAIFSIAAAQTTVPFTFFERSPEVVALMEDAIEEFESNHPGVDVEMTGGQEGAEAASLSTLVAVGADLGAFAIDRPLILEWANRGWLAPLDSLVEEIGAENFLPGAYITGPDGHVYAVASTGNAYGIYVNSCILEDAGVAVPETYEELLAAVQAVHNPPSVYGIGFPTSANKFTDWFATMVIYGQGGDIYDRDGNVVFDSPEVLAGLQKLEELMPYLPPGTNSWAFQNTADAFAAGRVAFAPQAGRLGVQMDLNELPTDDCAVVIEPPFGPVQATIGKFDYMAVWQDTEDVEMAKEFLSYFIQGEQILGFADTLPGHLIPALYPVQERFLETENAYKQEHPERIEYFVEAIGFAALPEGNMGAMTSNGLEVEGTDPPPWGAEVFGDNSILSQAVQRMYQQDWSPERAQEWATEQFVQVAEEWRQENQ